VTATLEPEAPTPEVRVAPSVLDRAFRPTPAGWAARAGALLVPALFTVWYVNHYAPVRADFLSGGVIIAIGALSLNVLVGYTGQISLGHQAFIGIGAFTSAYFIGDSGQSFYVGMAAAVVVGAVQAVALGLIALRVRGLYFALVTLAWGFVGEQTIFRLKGFTGGGAGAHASRPGGFTTDRMFFLFCTMALAVILLVDWRLVATKAGRALQAIRENPQVAANYGINVRGYTLFSFAVAGAYAGLAGALFASRRDTVSATDLSFSLVALPYLLVTVVGGLRRRGGIVAFALTYTLLSEYLPDLAESAGIKFIQDNAGNHIISELGFLAVLTLIFQPDGLATITSPIGRWLKGNRLSMHAGGGGGGSEGVNVRP
jgi:branched-chain amino acid transport system permease protein